MKTQDIHKFVISTPPFKLKDGRNNNHQFIDLKNQFKFTPRAILIEKVRGKNNVLVISAVPEELFEKLLKQAKGGEENASTENKSGSDKKTGTG